MIPIMTAKASSTLYSRTICLIVVAMLAMLPVVSAFASVCHSQTADSTVQVYDHVENSRHDHQPADYDPADQQAENSHHCVSCTTMNSSQNIMSFEFSSESPLFTDNNFLSVSLPVDRRPPKFS